MTENKNLIREIKKVENRAWNLDFLRDEPILPEEKVEQLARIRTDLMESFKKREMFRPRYLMEVSVLKDTNFPTPDAKYWQCVLERDTMFQNLLLLALDFREKVADAQLKKAKIEKLQRMPQQDDVTRARIAKLEAQLNRDLLQIALMRKEAEERYREIMNWTDIINELKPQLKYGTDDPEAHMPESFLLRFAYQKQLLEQAPPAAAASSMDGILNLLGLGAAAAKFWREHKNNKFKAEGSIEDMMEETQENDS